MKIEDLTLRELSDRVRKSNGREDQAADRARELLVRETTSKILALIERPPTIYSPPHPYRPYPTRDGCAACAYPRGHSVHLGTA